MSTDNDSIKDFIEEITGDRYFRIQDDLGEGFVRLKASEAQRRQAKQDIRSFEDVVLELLRNARDAQANMVFVATWVDAARRYLTVLDDGAGIPKAMHQKIFEPFVTSKLDSFRTDRWGVHGRGMALYSIHENVDSVYVQASETGLGSIFCVTNCLGNLPEKKDQSSLPILSKKNNGEIVLRGPHNIVRMLIEFALDERNTMAVFFGTPAEIVTKLFWLSGNTRSRLRLVFKTFDDKTPYIQRFSLVDNARELTELACSLGLPISERTAARIINRELEDIASVLEKLFLNNNKQTRGTKHQQSMSKSKGEYTNTNFSSKLLTEVMQHNVSFPPQDLDSFSKDVMQVFRSLADAYYLESDIEPIIQQKNDELILRFLLKPKL